MIVWDWGTYEPEETDEPAAALAAGELKLRLFGERLRGRFTLVKTSGRTDEAGRTEGGDPWLLIHKRDEAVVAGFDAEAQSRSVKTGRTNDELAAGATPRFEAAPPAPEPELDLSAAREAPIPEFAAPMLATAGDHPFEDPSWLHEVKWDGYRVQAVVRDGSRTTVDPQPGRRGHLLPRAGRQGALDRCPGSRRRRGGGRARRLGPAELLRAPGADRDGGPRGPHRPSPQAGDRSRGSDRAARRGTHRVPGLRPAVPRRPFPARRPARVAQAPVAAGHAAPPDGACRSPHRRRGAGVPRRRPGAGPRGQWSPSAGGAATGPGSAPGTGSRSRPGPSRTSRSSAGCHDRGAPPTSGRSSSR